ncbi:MAG TPA: NAD-dependent epimerase/dehydratase family protein [Ktedonobacterales bacterium]
MLLVTGAAGFVGSRLVARLAQEGERAHALVRDASTARNVLPADGYDLFIGDTTLPSTMDAALAGADTVIHTAFITNDRKQRPGVDYYKTNVLGTRNLLAAAKRAGVSRVIVLTGLGTMMRWTTGSYMHGRYEAVQAVRESGLAWSALGPSIMFGPRAAFFKGLSDLIRSVPIVVPMIGDGKVEFQPIWVEDVVTCLIAMAREPERYDGRVIDVGGPEVYTYAQILDLLMAKLHKRRIKVPGPMPLASLGASMMELVLPKPPVTRAAMALFESPNVTDIDAVEKNFGFTPRSLKSYLDENPPD